MTDIEFELPYSMLPNTTDTEVDYDDNTNSNVSATVSENTEIKAANAEATTPTITSDDTSDDTIVETQENDDAPMALDDASAKTPEETTDDKPEDVLDTQDDKPHKSADEDVIEIDWPSMVDKYSKMFTTKQLRDKLRDNGLVTSGTKGQMISRLHEHGVSLEDDDDSIEVSS